MNVSDQLRQWLEQNVGLSENLQGKLLETLLVLLVLVLLRQIALYTLRRRTDDVLLRYRWRKGITYSTVVVGLLLVGRVWFAGVQQLATFLGLVSAGLAIALKDMVADMAGWLFILWRRPFGVGDRIALGDHAGDVIDLRLFQFSLMEIRNWVDADQSTGRIIHVPNGMIFSSVLANYTKGFHYIWDEVPVLLTFESDWRRAKTLLQEIALRHGEPAAREARLQFERAASRFMIMNPSLNAEVFTSVADSGVLLTVRYLCNPRHRREILQAVWEDILAAFAQVDNIDFAYPTVRYYDNPQEGKPGARAEPPVPRPS